MPRPKVRLEDRQRSSRACHTCKALKIRCDSQCPCSSCMRRGQAHACVYSGTDRRRRKPCVNDLTTHGRAIDGVDAFSRRSGVTTRNSNPPFESDGHVSEMVTPESRSDDHPLPDARPHQRFSLKTDQTIKVDVGETSALSFLHFLRKTVKAYVGSVPFTDSERHHIVVDMDHCSSISVNVDCVEREKLHVWMGFYSEATSGILDLFTEHEVETLLAARTPITQDTSSLFVGREDAAAMDVALAIGAQVEGSPEDIHFANSYFHRARQVAFDDMLMVQNVETVRLFLLMAFYMLGACYRNAASMFLGVAARAAIVLELHGSEAYSTTLSKEDSERSLPTVPNWSNIMELNTESAFYAIGDGCILLDNIVDTLSKGKLLDIMTAEDLLMQLRKWSGSLPTTLRQFCHPFHSSQTLKPGDRQRLLGSIHISCLYYFAVILVTRPYLIAYLTSRLRGKAPDHLISDPDEASDVTLKNNKVSKLAQVCVSSSLYMVDMCRRAKSAGLVFRNFCLLKAWIFGAGLILGFSMFAGEPRRDVERLFDSALLLLDDIGRTSPQAQLYHQILTSFLEAVNKYRNRVAGEVYRTVQDYMDQILTIDAVMPGNSAAPPSGRQDVYPGWDDGWLAGAMQDVEESAIALDPISFGTKGAQMFREPCNWGDMDTMQLEGDLIIDVEPFDQLFYTVE
ncbi:hypothetical protein BDV41DRAFT_584082 [Aspergillus transmontanensis]|uniref:Zn(2)-C6 fungal-type domain-containing protein n=1 Tax=Aspergillus transmontanensis TaxID=1034304 RepID=A0A5N6VKY7_9EURO|nr:hypothetical protein BDV41DRAFT_584082 [Aspergillus transmontanensis]